MFRMMQNGELDVDVELDIDVEDGAVLGILSHRPLSLQHDVLPVVCYLAFMLSIKGDQTQKETSSKM